MSRLDDAANSVPAGEPAIEPDLEVTDPNPDPESTGEQDIGDKGEDGEGRSLENVRAEFQRKMERMQETNAQIAAELTALRAERTAPAPQPAPTKEPQTLDEMSLTQLETMRPTVPEDQKDAFDQYLIGRKVKDGVREGLSEFRTEHSYQQSEQKANEQAFSRWPQLHDKASQFYSITNRILKDMGQTADNNPQAVLHAANEAGLELNVRPQSFRPSVTRREPGGVQDGRTSRPTGRKNDDKLDLSTEEHQGIQKNLANAMPGRKFTKEQLARIEKRGKQYKDHIDLFTRG